MKNRHPDITLVGDGFADQEKSDLTHYQGSLILATKILIIAVGLMLLAFAAFNIVNYLSIRKRYRNYNDLFFYINVVMMLVCICI